MNLEIRQKLEKLLNNEHLDDNQLRVKAQELFMRFEMETQQFSAKNLQDLMRESVAQLETTDFGGHVIETGFKAFDDLNAGFRLGEFVVIGARPGMGSTQFLVNLAMNMSAQNQVLFASYDSSDLAISMRFLSYITGFTADQLLRNKLIPDEKEFITEKAQILEDRKIIVATPGNHSISAFKNFCCNQVEEHGIKIIMLDNIQLLTHYNYRNSREQEIAYVSIQLKNIAKELNICLIAISQLNRSVENRGGSKRPMLRDLRDSGGIEQNADKVIFLYRPMYYGLTETEDGLPADRLMELILVKNRNGSLNTSYLFHDALFRKFYDAESYKEQFDFSARRLDELENGNNPIKLRDESEDDGVPF